MFVASALGAAAQTNASNWTATDCSGSTHTLFTELDNRKIVVMAWVMPCASCIDGAKAAYNAVQAFNATSAGSAVLYVIDDMGDNDCVSLNNWV